MPKVIKKSTSTKAKTKTTKAAPKDELMEFEQFVAQKKERQGNKPKYKGFVVFALILLIIALSLTLFTDTNKDKENTPNSLTYKTIYLESGQQLYAKVIKEDSLYIYVDDVFYTKMETISIPSDEEGGEPTSEERARLIRRGGELNNPVGLMQINRAKVFAIDEMGQDSEILRLINEMKAEQ